MTCGEVMQQLDAFIDDELSADVSIRVADHLTTCAACTAQHDRLIALRHALRTQLPPLAAPVALRENLRRAAAAARQPASVTPLTTTRWRRRGLVGVMAAAAVLAITVFASRQLALHGATREALIEEVLGSHVRSLMGTHLTDVATSDQHTVKPWFNGKLDYSPPVTDFASGGYPLVGGRLDYLGGRPVAALVYGRRQHVINVFLWPAAGGSAAGSTTETRQGYHLIVWSTPSYAYWVVSDLGTAELDEFVQLLRANGE